MQSESGIPIKTLNVDGGASANNLLMQMQADYSALIVRRPSVRESTALGAAYLAGLAVGFWASLDELQRAWSLDKKFVPSITDEKKDELMEGWHKAVERTMYNDN